MIQKYAATLSTLLSKKWCLIIITILCVAALGVGFIAEYFFHILPCILCLYQRYIMGGIIIFSLLSLFIPLLQRVWVGRVFLPILCVGGVLLSVYHVGVENHWWKGPDHCRTQSPPLDPNASPLEQLKAFKERLNATNNTVVPCDQVNWRILGVSATLWTGLFYIFLLFPAIIVTRRHPDD